MVDYAKALNEGFEAAQRTERARKEIDEVFDDLNNQIINASDGKLRIERMRKEKVQGILPRSFIYSNPIEYYWVISAYNPKIGESKQYDLAKWIQDRNGYPCKVTWNQQEHICEDRQALSSCLAELLSDPIVGEKLYTLTKLEPIKKD
jgi:hypothetical protein